MSSPEDLESRLTAVERDVARLREELAASAGDSTAARVLASGADRDVSEVRAELRAHTSALNALRETQREQGVRLDRLEHKVDAGFAQVDANFDRVEERFAEVGAGLAQIVALIEGLDRS